MPEERFLIAPADYMDNRYASIYSTNESPSAPTTNLLQPHPGDWWIAPDPTSLQVTINLGLEAGSTWDFIAVLYSNFGPSCTWQVDAATTEAGLAAPTFQTLSIDGQQSPDMDSRSHEWVHSFVWSSATEWQSQGERSEDWVRISVNTIDPKLPVGYTGDPYVQWGNVVIAKHWRPPYSVERGRKVRREERPKRSRTMAGGNRLGVRRKPRRGSYTVGFLTHGEALTFVDDLDLRVGESGHVVTIFDPLDIANAHREMMYGTLAASDREHVATDVYKKQITITEAL